MTAPDVIIVGAGLNGLLTARECRLAGLRVAVIDRSAAATPASWAAGGILAPLQPWREPEATLALARAGRALYPPLIEWLSAATGIGVGYSASGMLVLAPDNSDEIITWAERNGENCLLLQADRLDAEEPAIAGGFSHGILLPDVHQIRNPRLLKALHQVLAGDEVGIVPAEGTVRLLIEGANCQGVEVDDVVYHADRIVLAAGAWSGQLLADVEPELPVRPMRGQMLAYEADAGLLRHILLHRRHYLVPRQEGLILAGSTVEDVGFDTATTADAAQDLRAMAGRLLPALADRTPVHHWAGLRPATADGLPYIGAHPAVDRLFLNYGHFRNGVLQAPASARLLADIMLDREPSLPPAWYAPARAV